MADPKDKDKKEETVESLALELSELKGENGKLEEENSTISETNLALTEANEALESQIADLKKNGTVSEKGQPVNGLLGTIRFKGIKLLRGTSVEDLQKGANKLSDKDIKSLGDRIGWLKD